MDKANCYRCGALVNKFTLKTYDYHENICNECYKAVKEEH